MNSQEWQLDMMEWLLESGYLATDLTCAELVELYRSRRAIPQSSRAEDDTLPVDPERRG